MLINTGGFYVLNEEYGRWREVYEDKGCDSREAFESLFETVGMVLHELEHCNRKDVNQPLDAEYLTWRDWSSAVLKPKL